MTGSDGQFRVTRIPGFVSTGQLADTCDVTGLPVQISLPETETDVWTVHPEMFVGTRYVPLNVWDCPGVRLAGPKTGVEPMRL